MLRLAGSRATARSRRGASTGDGAPGSPVELPPEATERLYPVAPMLVPDLRAPGGFRRVNIRMLPNGVAAC